MDIVRANITFPKDLLSEVDKVAGSGKRSAFLAESVREHLNRLKFAKVIKESAGIFDPKTYPNFSTPAKVRNYIRSFRKKNTLRF